MINPLKNEKGMAFVTVLMIMVVVVVFGMSVLTTATADGRHAVVQQRNIQANYLARAAVDDIGNYVLEHKTLPGVTIGDTATLLAGTYVVDEMDSTFIGGDQVVHIKATGEVDGVSSTVKLTLSEDNPSDIFVHAIYTVGPLDVENMVIHGDIGSGSTITYSDSGSNAYDTSLYTPSPGLEIDHDYDELPVDDVRTTPVSVWDGTSVIGTDATFDSISVPNHSTLTFDTGTSADVLTVAINNLETDGHGTIAVTGDGLLRLYIYNSLMSKGNYEIGTDTEMELYVYQGAAAEFQTPLTVAGSDPNKVRIYLGAGSTFRMQANGDFYCYIMGPEADIYFLSNDTTVHGSVIGNLLNPTGGPANGSVVFETPDDSWDVGEPGMRKRFYE